MELKSLVDKAKYAAKPSDEYLAAVSHVQKRKWKGLTQAASMFLVKKKGWKFSYAQRIVGDVINEHRVDPFVMAVLLKCVIHKDTHEKEMSRRIELGIVNGSEPTNSKGASKAPVEKKKFIVKRKEN